LEARCICLVQECSMQIGWGLERFLVLSMSGIAALPDSEQHAMVQGVLHLHAVKYDGQQQDLRHVYLTLFSAVIRQLHTARRLIGLLGTDQSPAYLAGAC